MTIPAENTTDQFESNGAAPTARQTAVIDERRQLINVAYRLLGSVADAEDVVQETYARWYALSPRQQDAIVSPGAWMTRVASRVCLDLLGSARARRERYVGEWIPEPVPDRRELTTGRSVRGTADPADRITLDESIGMAFLVMLESMTPAERVAFILHDVFGHPFAEVAEIVGRTPAACRQLASSARRRIRAVQAAPVPTTQQQTRVVQRFKQAWETMDIDALVDLLDPQATAISDSGGRVRSVRHPLEGARQIVRHLVDIGARPANLTLLVRTVNGRPGLVVQQDGDTVTVIAFDLTADKIKHLWAIRNPDKLLPWTTHDPVRALDESRS